MESVSENKNGLRFKSLQTISDTRLKRHLAQQSISSFLIALLGILLKARRDNFAWKSLHCAWVIRVRFISHAPNGMRKKLLMSLARLSSPSHIVAAVTHELGLTHDSHTLSLAMASSIFKEPEWRVLDSEKSHWCGEVILLNFYFFSPENQLKMIFRSSYI